MTDRDWKCADDDVLASLRAEESGAGEDAKERVFRRLAAGLGATLAASDLDAGMSPGATAGPARLGASVAALGRPGALALVFALGGGAGAAAYATLAPRPAPRIVYVDRVVTAPKAVSRGDESVPPASSDPAPIGPIDALPKRDGDVVRELPRAAGSAAKSGGFANLAAQQALLDEARASFGRGEHDAALRTIAVHERRYPDSVLTEEREALAIKALVASGRYEKAKSLGTRFAERYPRSLLLPAVRDALASIP